MTDWTRALVGKRVVVHCAGLAHITEAGDAGKTALFAVNHEGTLNLARQAVGAGVRRFVFISSIGVNGDENLRPFTETDAPNPKELYAVSKLLAEQGLLALAASSEMEVVIIRPPMVYGPNAPGNFGKLVRAVRSGIPLPLGAVHNQRTFLGLSNLADLVACCVDHPAAANEVFLAGDARNVSTAELARQLGVALKRPARLLPVPVRVLEVLATLIGRRATIRKMCGSLRVDIEKARRILGWTPPYTLDEGLGQLMEGGLN
ncbi:MAG: NAD-dependent epimerase/dehydratase family protein [Proteobacteria bacterium]|nr:NAD-dependent epimerase/dehydratase family protein [Pseudomonadota bacterium]